MRTNDYTNKMTVWNEKDRNAWYDIFQSDESIENFEVKNVSTTGYEVEFYWNYKKNVS